jgi:hypothetical protein
MRYPLTTFNAIYSCLGFFITFNTHLYLPLSLSPSLPLAPSLPRSLAPSLRGRVGPGGHTLLLWSGRRGFDPRPLRRTQRAFYPPLAI